ncbi:MAG: NPCBM/NEW2 domain-containing protein [Thermoguttaceae bacterium]|jgi:alpha-galactosidase
MFLCNGKRPNLVLISVFLAGLTFSSRASAAETVLLGSVDVSKVKQGWGEPHADKSVEGNQISIGRKKFEHGLGTHAASSLLINLKGGAERFTAYVGVDDEVGDSLGSVEFRILADDSELWKSDVMKAGQAPQKVDVDLKGFNTLLLLVHDAGDGIDYDHADWADAIIEYSGQRPYAVDQPDEPAVILTPKAPDSPRINGAKIFGVRPGSPFMYTIAAAGRRPMTFAADGLPEGLTLDPQTGRITGVLQNRGQYTVALHAENSLGKAQRMFKIVCGDAIALTPPMGWNSWNCFAEAVDDAKVRSAADAMVQSDLINHGWTYINIDDCWEIKPGSNDPKFQGKPRDENGMINTNKKFPAMKALCDYVHSKGLKIGIYSSPGPLTCAGFTGSYKYEEKDAQRYAEWGVDYLKYDWCSYTEIGGGGRGRPMPDRPTLKKPYVVMREALNKIPRDIHYSLCQYGWGNVWEWGNDPDIRGNSWRTTGDIEDTWSSMSKIGFRQAGHEKYAGPGHWNDPDMLVVGKVGWGNVHQTALTPNEQYTHISLWCLLCSPLLIGCDMTQLDQFTLNLLTNDEVLEISQDLLGKQAGRVAQAENLQVWAKPMEDGSMAVGLFNLGESEQPVVAKWSDLGLSGEQIVRDLWRQKDLGKFDNSFTEKVARHGTVLVRIRPAGK